MSRWPTLRAAIDASEKCRTARYSFLLGYLLGMQKVLADAELAPIADGVMEGFAQQAYEQYSKSPPFRLLVPEAA